MSLLNIINLADVKYNDWDLPILLFEIYNFSLSYNIIMNQNFDLMLKIVIVGDAAVGKTNLLSKYASN